MSDRVESHFNELLGAVYLSFQIRGRTRPDVTIRASHVGMSRDLICGIFRVHDMARCAAKLRGIHVGRAAVAGNRHNEKVDNGGHQHDIDAVAKHAVAEINFGEFRWNLTGPNQLASAEVNADWNKR